MAVSVNSRVQIDLVAMRRSGQLPHGWKLVEIDVAARDAAWQRSREIYVLHARSWASRHFALRSALVSGFELAVWSGGARGFLGIFLPNGHLKT